MFYFLDMQWKSFCFILKLPVNHNNLVGSTVVSLNETFVSDILFPLPEIQKLLLNVLTFMAIQLFV